MIHRRALAFLRKRDWAGMVFELLVVALGVLLGIEASNWNDRRARADRQQAVMKQLTVELDVMVKESDERVANARQIVSDLSIVRDAVESGRLDPRQSARFARGICSTNSWWQPAWRLSIVDQLIASGDLDLIANPDFRSALVGYRDTVMVIREDILGQGKFAQERSAAFDRFIDYAPGPGLLNTTSEADFVNSAPGRCETALAALRADPAARAAIRSVQRSQYGIFANQLVVAGQAKRLRAMVGRSR